MTLQLPYLHFFLTHRMWRTSHFLFRSVRHRTRNSTKLTQVEMEDGTIIDGKASQEPVSPEFYYIVPNKCTECTGFHEEPQCAAVCPVDCCVDDPDMRETKEELEAKKAWLHAE